MSDAKTEKTKYQPLAIDARLHTALKEKARTEGRKLGRMAEDLLWQVIPADQQPEDVRERLAKAA